MKDLHNAYIDFENAITLTDARKEQILTSRNAVRDKIRKYFKDELKLNQPAFYSQGSFTIRTALNPLPDKEVDIDDGLYLSHVDKNNQNTWPTPKEVHALVCDALKDHTQNGCEDKHSCVRVVYKNFYHLDIPIYIMKNNHALLADTKHNEWIESDSKNFKDWYFNERKNIQTTRIVKYLKAWRDYKEIDIPSIELTILVVENHISDEFDNIAIQKTVESIYKYLSYYRMVKKPVSPCEDLWENLTEEKKEKRIKLFENLNNNLKAANTAKTSYRGSLILRNIFGDRFPEIPEDVDEPIRDYSQGAKPWMKLT
ncbi:MAG: hypothetical protein HDR33_09680 [Treponema sp.]|nr:hypothetical protein [Treponema sp.]